MPSRQPINDGSWQILLPFSFDKFGFCASEGFSEASLSQLCEEAGWSIVRVVTPEHTIYWMCVLTKLL